MGPSHKLPQFRHPFPSYRNRPPLVSRFSASEVWTCDRWFFTRLPSSGDLPPYEGRATRGGRGRPGRAMCHATLGDRDLGHENPASCFSPDLRYGLATDGGNQETVARLSSPNKLLRVVAPPEVMVAKACAMSRETYFETP
ncbi:hypothetical protein NL676_012874 [Syzygium grande]|nr:hypothetical protein NL676_012874 [Syzygium grande]